MLPFPLENLAYAIGIYYNTILLSMNVLFIEKYFNFTEYKDEKFIFLKLILSTYR